MEAPVALDGVRARLDLPVGLDPWLRALEEAGPLPGAPLRLPSPEEAAALLAEMRVAPADIADVVGSLPSPTATPEVWWLLERGAHLLIRQMGRCDDPWTWPELPPVLGAHARLFNVYAFLAVTPWVRSWHRGHGVPDSVSAHTLASLGRSMAIQRRRTGASGVFEQNWMTLPFRACLFELGRLQYTPYHVSLREHWYDAEACARLGPGFRPGDPAVGVHIPATGPLRPEACDESLRAARDLFSGSEPFGPCRIATCGSWLLDEQLAEYLPPESNIVRFQRRFTLLPHAGHGDGSVFTFVFHRPAPASLDELPQTTTLERAVVRHLRDGRHWQTRTGWLEL